MKAAAPSIERKNGGTINEAFSSCRSLPTQLTVIMQHLNLLQLQWQLLQGKRERAKALFDSPTYLSKTSCATATLFGCLVVPHSPTERRVNQCRFFCTDGGSPEIEEA
ncbi:uncharacterized protein LOC111469901 [Cucurbita maxima]|uniref:Uncharacterized protein LOC111469901 n=1 Tax=Cucurbita maxima TaxID=3661 RepID=A0A6J1I151_CUCMA|nr:uncharacterized protein LOC111469901 [Cucurbita maxima]XP_022971137.1 uncharacterized protein LOC111469901 [Cucurbita maxima]XP_022971138.1 uncharacterized protein LOC111469901 [Cucurbita maxima]